MHSAPSTLTARKEFVLYSIMTARSLPWPGPASYPVTTEITGRPMRSQINERSITLMKGSAHMSHYD